MNKVFSNKALPAGTVLREWRLEQVLGVGGFGIVYRGRGIYFDELVAIKEYFPSAISDRKDGDTVVPSDSAAEEVHALGLKKFVEEAKLLWNLSKPTRHPNIVSVRSLFEIHGTAYMVMDFEDGVSLSDLLKQGKTFSQESLFALLRPVAEGLDRAHRVGVLHRDIKPANILVSEDGRPVLIDFGSARFESGDATSTSVTFHTPPYAAIEQYVKTYDQGPWTDIYALGVAMHECITGTKPPEVLERLHGGLGQALADQVIPGYSKAFLRAVDAAMIIRPGDRPQSIPQWLALFDLPDDAELPSPGGDEEATRFATFQSLPEEIIAVVPPVPMVDVAAAGVPPVEPQVAKPLAVPAKNPDGKSRAPLVAGSAAILALLAGGGYFAMRSGGQAGKAPDASLTPIQAAQPTVNLNDSNPAALTGLASQFDALVGDARKVGRSSGLASLIKAQADLNALAGQLPSLKDPAAIKAQGEKMGQLARDASASFSAALVRDANGKAAELARNVPWADPRRPLAANGQPANERAAAGAVQQAFGKLRDAASVAAAAADPLAAIAASRQASVAAAQLSPVIARMATFSATARRAGLEAAVSQGRALAQQIIELGKAGKPGLFASREKRESWKLRQDNANRAQAELAELARLAAVSAPAEMAGATASAKRISASLAELHAASTRAAPQGK